MRVSRVAPWGLVIVAFGLAVAVTLTSGCADTPGGGRRGPGSQEPGTRVDSGLVGADTGTAAASDAGVVGPLDTGKQDPEAGIRFFDARAVDDGGPDSGTGAGGDSGTGAGGDSGTGAGGDSGTGIGGPDAGGPNYPDAAPPNYPDAAPPVFPDAAPPPGNGDIWIELDYSNANTPRSPTFRYSATPGWGERQWAAVNANYPEAWDRFNNMQVVNDPIGRSLEIGSGSELQLMIGLEELVSYQYATVHLEGRSRATSSQVTFDVYNPWNGCGAAGAQLGQQWTVQPVDLDLSTCYDVGQGVQAVRVDPTNGTIALVRLRLTLHGAVY